MDEARQGRRRGSAESPSAFGSTSSLHRGAEGAHSRMIGERRPLVRMSWRGLDGFAGDSGPLSTRWCARSS